ncbi:type II toxin-antitoxin system RelE family toxin [Leptolyngbya sp. AN03gr2]|uniref:type II toxin-antitoxin system RelE family toxin n=1 Tax=unclassified Leptolyngbya TaxID=2650499 RepID=UPI003D31BA88
MPFEIVFTAEAVEDIRNLRADLRAKARSAIETYLRHEPMKVSKSRIKRLRGLLRPQYRLRVDELRVFYDIDEETVQVLAIVPKSEAETWLERNGEADEGSDSERGAE